MRKGLSRASLPRPVAAGEPRYRSITFRPRGGARPEQATAPHETGIRPRKFLISLRVFHSKTNLHGISDTEAGNDRPFPAVPNEVGIMAQPRREKASLTLVQV